VEAQFTRIMLSAILTVSVDGNLSRFIAQAHLMLNTLSRNYRSTDTIQGYTSNIHDGPIPADL